MGDWEVSAGISRGDCYNASMIDKGMVQNAAGQLPQEAEQAESSGKLFAFYPPGGLFQRGEERCQANVDSSTATNVRAPNDLAMVSAIAKRDGWTVLCRDYAIEKHPPQTLLDDFDNFNPDMVFLSTTNTTIHEDLEVLRQLKHRQPNLGIIIKGGIFRDISDEARKYLDLAGIDYLVGGEFEFIMGDILKAHRMNPPARIEKLKSIPGLLYRNSEGQWVKTDFEVYFQDLDSLPYPDRSAIRNELYVRPDTSQPQATITTSRGCPSRCIYCQTPLLSGRRFRMRSPENILGELKECYFQYGISDFFFRSDSFTCDGRWVRELCDLINQSSLKGRIRWVANSRVKPLELQTLEAMRQAGCWLVAFGFESGSDESLTKMQKGTSVQDNRRACELARKAGLKIFGFYMIGFPWETEEHLQATRDLMFENNTDFVELHMAIPYYGTPLFELARQEGLLEGEIFGRDYFSAPSIPTKFLTREELLKFHRKTLLSYHIRPSYIFNKLRAVAFSPRILMNYARFGGRLLKNCWRK